MIKCDRCEAETQATIMSYFNTDTLCLPCKADEKELPTYSAAVEAEHHAVRQGNYNFQGIGLNEEEIIFLKSKRESREHLP